MKIVQKVLVYSDHVGEEVVGIGAMDSGHLQNLIQCHEAAKLIAKVSPAPDIIEYRDFCMEFFKMPDFYDLEESNVDLFNDLDNEKFVLMDDLSPLGIDEENDRSRVDSVYIRFYTSRLNEVLWAGYIRGTYIEIELPGFYLNDLIKEVKAYETKHGNQGSEQAVS